MSRLRPLFCFVVCVLVLAPSSASALEIAPGGATLEVLNGGGEAATEAGSHPDRLIQGIEFTDPEGTKEEPKEMAIDLPAGIGGDPGAAPLCPRVLFDEVIFAEDGGCPANSQVGVAIIGIGEEESSTPLYSVEPGPNQVAVFGIQVNPLMKLVASLRPSDLGLSMRLSDLSQNTEGSVYNTRISSVRIELWGIPADHQEGTSIPRKPLLTLPSRCDGQPLISTVSAHTWQRPERWFTGSGDNGHPLTSCERMPFDPAVSFSLDTPNADTPSGVGVDVSVPQNADPDGLASSQLKDTAIALPQGMALSPGAAQGLSACTEAQLGLRTATDPTCPPASRVGTLEISVPSLAKPLRGLIYLGSERPGERFRLFMAASGSGAQVKLTGSLQPDPVTGRLTANLKDLPQASFSRMSLHFDGGPGALLATPLTCGPATANATLTPQSNPALGLVRSASASVTPKGASPCSTPSFAPTLSAGSTVARAGRPTSFSSTVKRADGEALPERLSLTLPKGMSAALGSVSPCQALAVTANACPASSKVGTTMAELGPGQNPAQVQGNVYLTGPYRHSPYGLLLTFKASLGPFDFGTIAVKAQIQLDSQSAQATIVTDSLPTTFEGIPIRFQTIGLDLDRKGFIRNPTSCIPSKVSASVSSSTGALANPATPFAIHGCIDLPFKPKLAMALGQGSRPSLQVTTKLPAKSANLRSLAIELPKRLKLDSTSLRELCSRYDAIHGKCTKASAVGTASGRTPLLGKALKGSLYLAQPQDDGPPDLWASLEGEGMQIELRGELSVTDGRAQTSFGRAPDFPLARLGLRFFGGEHGLMELRGGACGAMHARVELAGHNRAEVRDRIPVVGRRRCERGQEPGN